MADAFTNALYDRAHLRYMGVQDMYRRWQERNSEVALNPFATVQDISPEAAAQHYSQMRGNGKDAAAQWLHNYNPSLADQLMGKG